MVIRVFAFALFSTCCLIGSDVAAQGSAIGGVLNRVEEFKEDHSASQSPISKGPKDSLERIAPGRIDRDAAPRFSKTNSGLRYRILRNSTKTKPKADSVVVAHYKGWLDNKQVFDSSYRKGKPVRFPLSRVIKGWSEGLQLIGEGGMIELDVPSDLGYGKEGKSPKIPPQSRLHFIVELVSIE